MSITTTLLDGEGHGHGDGDGDGELDYMRCLAHLGRRAMNNLSCAVADNLAALTTAAEVDSRQHEYTRAEVERLDFMRERRLISRAAENNGFRQFADAVLSGRECALRAREHVLVDANVLRTVERRNRECVLSQWTDFLEGSKHITVSEPTDVAADRRTRYHDAVRDRIQRDEEAFAKAAAAAERRRQAKRRAVERRRQRAREEELERRRRSYRMGKLTINITRYTSAPMSGPAAVAAAVPPTTSAFIAVQLLPTPVTAPSPAPSPLFYSPFFAAVGTHSERSDVFAETLTSKTVTALVHDANTQQISITFALADSFQALSWEREREKRERKEAERQRRRVGLNSHVVDGAANTSANMQRPRTQSLPASRLFPAPLPPLSPSSTSNDRLDALSVSMLTASLSAPYRSKHITAVRPLAGVRLPVNMIRSHRGGRLTQWIPLRILDKALPPKSSVSSSAASSLSSPSARSTRIMSISENLLATSLADRGITTDPARVCTYGDLTNPRQSQSVKLLSGRRSTKQAQSVANKDGGTLAPVLGWLCVEMSLEPMIDERTLVESSEHQTGDDAALRTHSSPQTASTRLDGFIAESESESATAEDDRRDTGIGVESDGSDVADGDDDDGGHEDDAVADVTAADDTMYGE